MAKRVPVLLPEIPRELETPADGARRRARNSAKKKMAAGNRLVSAVVPEHEITFLMSEWGFATQAEMVRVAMRYLAAQTRGGLTSITVDVDASQ